MTKPLLALALGLGLCACGENAAQARKPPNLILISIDTLRADHLGTYGYARDTSPEIDALAARSIVFDAAYSHSPKTAPSHMSLLTGVVPDMHGVENIQDEGDNRPLPPGLPTVAELLREQGYRTAAVTGGGHVIKKLGFDRGFDSFETSNQPERIFDLGWNAIRKQRGGDRPFFLFLHTYAVHDPYTPPAEFRELWADPEYAGDIRSERQDWQTTGVKWQVRHEEFWSRVKSDDPADVRHLQDLYDGLIRYVDGVVGSFLKKLEEKGLAEDTVVVLVADHGEEFQEHGAFLHENVYQELLRVPLILHVPEQRGGARGVRVDTTVRLIDVLPTLLQLADVPVPDHVQGDDLLGLLDATAADERSVFSTWPREKMYALRRGRYKLIERPSSPVELYDLDSDPGERTNLAVEPTPEHAEILARLLDELNRVRSASQQFHAAKESGAEVELSEEERQQLQALGYLK